MRLALREAPPLANAASRSTAIEGACRVDVSGRDYYALAHKKVARLNLICARLRYDALGHEQCVRLAVFHDER